LLLVSGEAPSALLMEGVLNPNGCALSPKIALSLLPCRLLFAR
jgi:hypothetical protein